MARPTPLALPGGIDRQRADFEQVVAEIAHRDTAEQLIRRIDRDSEILEIKTDVLFAAQQDDPPGGINGQQSVNGRNVAFPSFADGQLRGCHSACSPTGAAAVSGASSAKLPSARNLA